MSGTKHKLIVTIVNKGKGDHVADVACQAGAKGGTIIPGRGIAVRLILGISIEPEKDIVLTLIEEEKVDVVYKTICEKMYLHEPSKGISFVLPLDKVLGLGHSSS